MAAAALPPIDLNQCLWHPPGINTYHAQRTQRWNGDRLTAAVNSMRSLFVVDLASDGYLVQVQRHVDAVKDDQGKNALHFACNDKDGGSLSLAKDLLQLGADPDVLDRAGMAVSHRCSSNGWAAYAAVIGKCRPDVSMAQGKNMDSPLHVAMFQAAQIGGSISFGQVTDGGTARVAEIWRKAAGQGPPSLAQLAHGKDWWAVHNVCRRRIVSEAEKRQAFGGRNAVQWAKFHGQNKVAEELVYLLELKPDEPTESKQHSSNGKVEEMLEKLLVAIPDVMSQARQAEQVKELKTEVAELRSENQALKKELTQLKTVLVAQAGEAKKLMGTLGGPL